MELKRGMALLMLGQLTVAFAAILPSVSTGTDNSGVPSNATFSPNTFIVELVADFHAPLSVSESFAKTPLAQRKTYDIRHEYSTPKYFRGLSVTFNEAIQLETLKASAGVKNAWKVSILHRPQQKGSSIIHSNATGITTNYPTQLSNYRGSAEVNTPLDMGNVKRLHDQGIRGHGMQIAIIDTGVDYRHPALGGGFGAGHKIHLGYDFVGDNYNGSNDPRPDDNPLATCPGGGHGTHAAGIMVMEDPDDKGFGLIGVAPEATLAVYRIFGCDGGTTTDIFLAAMLRAATEGAVVMSLSVGEFDDWEIDNPFQSVVDRLHRDGVGIIGAVGNFGTASLYAAARPALTPGVFSVGSVESDVYPTTFRAYSNHNEPLDYISVFPLPHHGPMGVFLLGTGLGVPLNSSIASGCNADAWNTTAIQNINWDTTLLAVQFTTECGSGSWNSFGAQLGVQVILAYTADEAPQILLDEPGPGLQTLYLNQTTSLKLLRDLRKVSNYGDYHLTFDNTHADITSPNPYGRTVDYFSSYGPTIEMTLQPKISAPGGSILSTWPLEVGGYAVLSGTSMSAPFVAASYALLKSQFGHYTVDQLYTQLQVTATPLKGFNSSLLASTAQQGGGLINVYDACKADLMISPSELNLRDATHPAAQTIRLANMGKSRQTYQIHHDPAAYIRVFYDYLAGDQTNYSPNGTIFPEAIFSTARLSTASLTLGASESASIMVHFAAPKELYPYSIPAYSGFISIEGSHETTYSIPYIGVPYSRYEVGPIAHGVTSVQPYASPGVLVLRGDTTALSSAKLPHPDLNVYTWSLNTSESQIPLLRVDSLLPSEFIRLELVPANVSFTPDLYGFDPKVEIQYEYTQQPIYAGFLGVPTHGIIKQWSPGGPMPVNPATVTSLIDPVLFIATVLQPPTLLNESNQLFNFTSGDYRPLCRALRWNGNLTNPDDYESWLGPVIRARVA